MAGRPKPLRLAVHALRTACVLCGERAPSGLAGIPAGTSARLAICEPRQQWRRRETPGSGPPRRSAISACGHWGRCCPARPRRLEAGRAWVCDRGRSATITGTSLGCGYAYVLHIGARTAATQSRRRDPDDPDLRHAAGRYGFLDRREQRGGRPARLSGSRRRPVARSGCSGAIGTSSTTPPGRPARGPSHLLPYRASRPAGRFLRRIRGNGDGSWAMPWWGVTDVSVPPTPGARGRRLAAAAFAPAPGSPAPTRCCRPGR